MTALGYLYGAIANARNRLYRKGVFKSFSLGVPTISIGNITAGGTGKTPMVAFVAQTLAGKGETVCILTRGYKRRNSHQRVLVSDGEKILTGVEEAGDEPFELAQKLLGKAIVVADKNRVEAGNWAREKFGVTAFVLDDAFQHLRARRDLDIVCIDATNPFGNRKVLPDGTLREPLQNLSRANAIVITRANLAGNLETLKSEISTFNKTSPIFVSNNKISGFIQLNEFHSNKQPTANNEQRTRPKALAFCALGNPNSFFAQLKQESFNIAATEIFPDHHFYSQKDIEKLEKRAKKEHAEILLTTAKDGVKLKNLKFGYPCYIAENTLIFEDKPAFLQLIFKKFYC